MNALAEAGFVVLGGPICDGTRNVRAALAACDSRGRRTPWRRMTSETIRRAIAYGHDTDTTSAVAGGLAGDSWGITDIPGEWRAGMRGKEIV